MTRLALVVCIVLMTVVAVLTPDPSKDFPRKYVDVGVGELGVARGFDAQVSEVSLASRIDHEYGDPLVTGQVWVVVSLLGRAHTQGRSFSEVTLRTQDDREYLPRSEFAGSGLASSVQPGFQSEGTLVFEVPPQRVPGARLVIDRQSEGYQAYDTAVRVDLELTEETRVRADAVVLPEPRIEVIR